MGHSETWSKTRWMKKHHEKGLEAKDKGLATSKPWIPLIKKALDNQAVRCEVLLKLKVGTSPLLESELLSWLRSLGLAQNLSNWLPTTDTQNHFLFH